MKAMHFLALGILFLTFNVSVAQSWTKLGSAKVTGASDHDEIWVTGIQGDFTAIKLFVQNEGIEFDRVAVTYGNGTKDEMEIRSFIQAGGETRVLDLRGGDRVIRKIDFWYKSNPNTKRKTQVVVYGRR